MSRRIAVLTTGALLLLLLGLVGTTLPVPYVAQVPGPTYNTLADIDGEPIITVEGREPNDVDGNLNLTTVGVGRGGLSLVQAVRGWFAGVSPPLSGSRRSGSRSGSPKPKGGGTSLMRPR